MIKYHNFQNKRQNINILTFDKINKRIMELNHYMSEFGLYYKALHSISCDKTLLYIYVQFGFQKNVLAEFLILARKRFNPKDIEHFNITPSLCAVACNILCRIYNGKTIKNN